MEGVLWILSIFSTVPCVRVCTKVVFKSVYLYFAFYLKYLLWNLLFRFFIIIIIFCVPFLSFTYFTVLWLESLTLYLIRIAKKAFFLDFFLILEGKHAFLETSRSLSVSFSPKGSTGPKGQSSGIPNCGEGSAPLNPHVPLPMCLFLDEGRVKDRES